MKKLTGILKSLTLMVWMIVLVVSITFLSQGFSGKTPLLMASETKQQAKKGQTGIEEEQKPEREGQETAEEKQKAEIESGRMEKLQAFLNHAKSAAFFGKNEKKSKNSSETDTKKMAESDDGQNNQSSSGSQKSSKTDDKEKETSKNQEEQRYAYLTFDDGPSDNTDRILDILKEKNVKATFFVVGKTDEKSKKRYQRIINEGHSLGMHSYTHDYSYIYSSMAHYKEDLMKLQDYLYEVTGERVKLYRFPGGSSNSVSKIPIQSCINYLDKKGIIYYDWNASSEDAVSIGTSCDKLNENILKDALLYHNTVILMHDLHECTATVKGLEPLIDKLQKEGYILDAITQETVPVQHVKDKSKESAKK